jgi:hypothetical protein
VISGFEAIITCNHRQAAGTPVAGSGFWMCLQARVLMLDIPHSDWTAEPVPNGERINMGAYGGTPYASMSFGR